MRQDAPCRELWTKGCPGPGGWNLSATGHRGEVMIWGILRVLVSLVSHGDAQQVVGCLGLEIRMKLWPEDLRCVCVCPRVLTEQLGRQPLSRGAPHPQPPLSGESLQPRAGRTLPAGCLPAPPPSLSAFAAIQGERELGTPLPGSVPTLCGCCGSLLSAHLSAGRGGGPQGEQVLSEINTIRHQLKP